MPKTFFLGLLLPLCGSLLSQNCPGDFTLGPDATVCTGNELTLSPEPVPNEPLQIEWSGPADLTVGADELSARVSPDSVTTYALRVRSLVGPQLVSNGNFNLGNVGFSSEYSNWTGNGNIDEGRYRVTNNPRNVHSNFAPCPDNGGGGNMMVVNAATSTADLWCQTIPVVGGETYAFSAHVATVVSQNPAELQFRINGQLLGEVFNAPFATCQWVEFFELWESGTATTATICINNRNTNLSGNDFALDDISFRRTCLSTDEITVTPVAAPVVRLGGDDSFCDRTPPRSLTSFVDEGPTDGTFTLDGMAASGSIDFSALATGDHSLNYVAGPAGCENSDAFTFTVSTADRAGDFFGGATDSLTLCSSTLTLAREHLVGFDGDPGGNWTIIGGTVEGAVDATGVISWPSPARGTYRVDYEIPATATCPGENTSFTLVVHPQAEVSLGEDRNLTCDQPSLLLRNQAVPVDDFTYVWSREGTTLSAGQELEITQGGRYVLAAINSFTGCGAADSIEIAALVNTATLQVQTTEPNCINGNDLSPGAINVQSVGGVTPPLLFSLNDAPFGRDSLFGGLAPGTYTLSVEDAGGCSVDTTVTFDDPRAFGFRLTVSGDTAVEYGTAISVGLQTNLPAAQLTDLRWFPEGIAAPGDDFFIARAGDTLHYGVSLVTPAGCRFADSLRLRPFYPQLVYAPNAFSPNEDGQNDTWFPFTHPAVARVADVRVFDRWGNAMFSLTDPPLNAPENGWNGQFNGRRQPNGVYLWTVEVELVDGTTERFSGEAILLR